MKKLKMLEEFDYYLWKDAKKRCFIKIIKTGEVSEVSAELFRFLRSEEKRLQRQFNGEVRQEKDNVTGEVTKTLIKLSLDFNILNEVESSWLRDKTDYEEIVVTQVMVEEFRKNLTQKQIEIFDNCVLRHESVAEFSNYKNVTRQNIYDQIKVIRKKFIDFYYEG